MIDFIELDASAATSADTAFSGSGTVANEGNGKQFYVTEIAAEKPCKLQIEQGGKRLAGNASGGGLIPERDQAAHLVLPVPFVMDGATAYSFSGKTLDQGFSANNGIINLIGYWA